MMVKQYVQPCPTMHLHPNPQSCCAGGQEAVHGQHQGRDDPADLHHAQGSGRQPAPVHDDATRRGQVAAAGSGAEGGMTVAVHPADLDLI